MGRRGGCRAKHRGSGAGVVGTSPSGAGRQAGRWAGRRPVGFCSQDNEEPQVPRCFLTKWSSRERVLVCKDWAPPWVAEVAAVFPEMGTEDIADGLIGPVATSMLTGCQAQLQGGLCASHLPRGRGLGREQNSSAWFPFCKMGHACPTSP